MKKVVKGLFAAVMLVVTSREICSAPAIGKDVPQLMALLEKAKPINMPNAQLQRANLSFAQLRGADLT